MLIVRSSCNVFNCFDCGRRGLKLRTSDSGRWSDCATCAPPMASAANVVTPWTLTSWGTFATPIFPRQHISPPSSRSNKPHQTSNIIIIMDSNQVEKQPLLEDQSGPEPTLAELQQNIHKAQRAYMRAWSKSTSGKWHKRIIFSVTGLLLFFMIFCISIIAVDVWNEDDAPYSSGRVPVEAFIMSKCPDARDCLHDMVLPAMQKINRKVDFKLSYIGR